MSAEKGPVAATLQAGARIGHYEVLRPLGQGGMGAVWRARDLHLGREVALKVFHPGNGEDAESLRLLEREARAASALSHPNIVTVYAVETAGPVPFIAMELVEGSTLAAMVQNGPLAPERALSLAAQVADGLAAAHEAGLVHRDVKPANVVVTVRGTAKLLDFGLARRHRPVTASADEATLRDSWKTSPGALLGTVGYMSPEQAAGTPVDFRSDQFALALVVYELLSGRRAFTRPTAMETLAAILRDEPEPLPPLPAPIDDGVRTLVARCLSKEPEGRYASTRDLAWDLRALARVASGESTRSTRPRLVPAAEPDTAAANRRRSAVLVTLLLLATAFTTWTAARSRPVPLPTFRQLTFQRGTVWSARFVPGGDEVVYGATWEADATSLFTTRAGSGPSTPLGAHAGSLLSVAGSGELAVSLDPFPVLAGMMQGTLARMPLAGGAPRELQVDVDFADFVPGSTEDLVVARREGGQARLLGPGGRVLFSRAGWISNPRCSADGRLVAFLHHPALPDDRGNVLLVPLAGGEARTLSVGPTDSGWPSALGLAWSPDGREVWFTATGSEGKRALRAVSLRGRERTLCKVPGNLTLHDVSRTGRVLASHDHVLIGVVREGESTPVRDESWLDSSLLTDLSSDGTSLLFTEFGEGGGPNGFAFLRLTGGLAKRLGEGTATALSPDGRRVLALVPGPKPLAILPTGPGPVEWPSIAPVAALEWAGWMPDGSSVFLAGSESDGGTRLWRLEPSRGPARPISGEGIAAFFGGVSVSPDGARIVSSGADGSLLLVSTRGSKAEPVPGVEPRLVPVSFLPDGRTLLAYAREGPQARLVRVDVETGASTALRLLRPPDVAGVIGIPTVRTTRDGSTWVYSYARVLSQLYLVEGLK